MNVTDFIGIVKNIVHDRSVTAIISNLKNPPGRSPSLRSKRLSSWYNNLTENDRGIVNEIVARGVHSGIFNFLCILDNVITIEGSPNKESIKLCYSSNNTKCEPIADDKSEMLHDLYQSEVQDQVL